MKKLILLILSSCVLFAGNISVKETVKIPKDAKCLIRKTEVYKHPEWASIIVVKKDNQKIYFSSPKSMFEFYFETPRWPEYEIKEDKDIEIYVTDYNTLETIYAKEAYYVYGSKKTSPAGDDLPAFSTKKDANAFSILNGGTRVFHFSDIPHGLINLLNNRLR